MAFRFRILIIFTPLSVSCLFSIASFIESEHAVRGLLFLTFPHVLFVCLAANPFTHPASWRYYCL